MKKIPNFSLQDQYGKTWQTKDLLGVWSVLYFYPKDNTPGCTIEACSFRDERDAIAQIADAQVIGVSKDSVQSHKRFSDLHHLNFTLLSDPDKTFAASMDSLKEKSMFGKHFTVVARNTFIIDPTGAIAKEYQGVNPVGHASQIIEDLKALRSAQPK